MLDITRAYGLTFLFPARDTAIGASLRDYGEFARPEADLVISYLDQFKEPGTFIDVGANVGTIALPVAAKQPRWNVIAVEAHRGLSHVLGANALNNQLHNVQVLHAAVGAEVGTTRFPAASLASNINFGVLGVHFGDKIPSEHVLMLSLDEIADPDTRFVKIDVEGAEGEALKGAGNLINKVRPIWLLEANKEDRWRGHTEESVRQTMRVMLDASYRLFWFLAPFTTANSAKAPPNRRMQLQCDMNFLALPEGVTNSWGLPEIPDHNAPWPIKLSEFSYMKQYGFEDAFK